MTRLQLSIIASAIALFFVLYFGCETQPKKQQLLEKSRALAAERTDATTLIEEAFATLAPAERSAIETLAAQAEAAGNDTAQAPALFRQLSGEWYKAGFQAIAGYYAQLAAEAVNDDQSWSIAGTTYLLCFQQAPDEKSKSFCLPRAITAFENAISIAPENVTHRVNLALCYVESPPQDNPMKGILMLRDLNDKYPDNTAVINQLARLAIKTGQYDRAIERLNEALRLNPDDANANCLMALALEETGKAEEAAKFDLKCPK
ncbi:MAG: tetratricopeptide repeat protein [Saprospiraceae bacterium]|nr:tetratricopeptide repeat protein [Saprospiraceae bacterium]